MVGALAVGLAFAGAAFVAVTAPRASAATGCTVTYQPNAWTNGFTANVRLSGGDQALSGWTLTWTYPGDAKVTNAWNATVTQSGTAVTARDAGWNGTVPANGTAEFGVQGTYTGTLGAPTGFTLNGVACNGGGTSSPTPSQGGSPSPSQGGSLSPSPSSPSPSQSGSPRPSGPVGCNGAALCDGFETQTGTTPSGGWTMSFPNCSGTGTATVDTGIARSGTKSLRVNGGGGYCNHVFVQSTVDLSRVGSVRYTRFYVRHTTALPATHTTFAAMRDSADGNKDLRMGGQNGALQWNRESDDATLPEQSPTGVSLSKPLPTNAWNCVEYTVDGAAGTLRTWLNGTEVTGLVVDGVPTHDVDSQWLARGNWRPALTDLRLGWESYGSDADTLWFDDVVVGTSRVGC
ncbi:hydrolase [Virgisporangium aliadipatigenens]|uniref:Hydrolase n=1 Tax=Virgisporangium aliadipatigenens TaxID=741659 RepID=A0A8J3YJS8_9ACTN|nr:hydrolase [Virgisporangium aliadipatigenens]